MSPSVGVFACRLCLVRTLVMGWLRMVWLTVDFERLCSGLTSTPTHTTITQTCQTPPSHAPHRCTLPCCLPLPCRDPVHFATSPRQPHLLHRQQRLLLLDVQHHRSALLHQCFTPRKNLRGGCRCFWDSHGVASPTERFQQHGRLRTTQQDRWLRQHGPRLSRRNNP